MNVESEIRSMAAGVRAVALAFILIVAYLNVRLALQIAKFQGIFADMLGDKPLPPLTQMVFQGRLGLITLAFLIPIIGVLVAVLLRGHKAALYTLAGLMVAAFVQMHLTWNAVFAPFMAIVSGMSAQP